MQCLKTEASVLPQGLSSPQVTVPVPSSSKIPVPCSSADGQCLWALAAYSISVIFHPLAQKVIGQTKTTSTKGSHLWHLGTGSTFSATRQVTWDIGPSASHPSDMTPPVRGRFKVLLYLPAVNGLIKVTERRSYGCLLKFYY